MDNIDGIYDDLPDFDLGSEVDKLQSHNKELEERILHLEADAISLTTTISQLKIVQQKLEKNISELFLTAKGEITRKNKMISELREQIDNMCFGRRNTNIEFKRKRESSDESLTKKLKQEGQKIDNHHQKSKNNEDRERSKTPERKRPEKRKHDDRSRDRKSRDRDRTGDRKEGNKKDKKNKKKSPRASTEEYLEKELKISKTKEEPLKNTKNVLEEKDLEKDNDQKLKIKQDKTDVKVIKINDENLEDEDFPKPCQKIQNNVQICKENVLNKCDSKIKEKKDSKTESKKENVICNKLTVNLRKIEEKSVKINNNQNKSEIINKKVDKKLEKEIQKDANEKEKDDNKLKVVPDKIKEKAVKIKDVKLTKEDSKSNQQIQNKSKINNEKESNKVERKTKENEDKKIEKEITKDSNKKLNDKIRDKTVKKVDDKSSKKEILPKPYQQTQDNNKVSREKILKESESKTDVEKNNKSEKEPNDGIEKLTDPKVSETCLIVRRKRINNNKPNENLVKSPETTETLKNVEKNTNLTVSQTDSENGKILRDLLEKPETKQQVNMKQNNKLQTFKQETENDGKVNVNNKLLNQKKNKIKETNLVEHKEKIELNEITNETTKSNKDKTDGANNVDLNNINFSNTKDIKVINNTLKVHNNNETSKIDALNSDSLSLNKNNSILNSPNDYERKWNKLKSMPFLFEIEHETKANKDHYHDLKTKFEEKDKVSYSTPNRKSESENDELIKSLSEIFQSPKPSDNDETTDDKKIIKKSFMPLLEKIQTIENNQKNQSKSEKVEDKTKRNEILQNIESNSISEEKKPLEKNEKLNDTFEIRNSLKEFIIINSKDAKQETKNEKKQSPKKIEINDGVISISSDSESLPKLNKNPTPIKNKPQTHKVNPNQNDIIPVKFVDLTTSSPLASSSIKINPVTRKNPSLQPVTISTRRRITPTPVKSDPVIAKPCTTFQNVLEPNKTVNPTSETSQVDTSPFRLTQDGEIPVLHLEENHITNLPTETNLNDKNIICLLDTVEFLDMECDKSKFKSVSDQNITPNSNSNACESQKSNLTFENVINKVIETPIENRAENKTALSEVNSSNSSINSSSKSLNNTTNSNLSSGTNVRRRRRRCRLVVVDS